MNSAPPVALVTGSARRIGAEICRHLHQQEYRVLIHYRYSEAEAKALAAELNQVRPDSARTLRASLTELTELRQLADAAQRQWGRLDALINNASAFYPTELAQTTEAQWDELTDANLKAPFFLCQALAPALRASSGVVINLADIHAERPPEGFSVYAISKAGLLMLTRSLAKELAPDIRVNAVAPGPILWPEGEAAATEAQQQQLLAKTPLGRMGTPTEIASAVLFLLQQQYITGQILAVDGGKSLYS